MTVFAAVRALDGSVAMASDSLLKDPATGARTLTCKLLPHRSGYWLGSWAVPGGAVPLPDGLVDAGWSAWRGVQALCRERHEGLLAGAQPHLFFAGLDDAGSPALLRWQGSAVGEFAAPGVYLGGLFTCPEETGLPISAPAAVPATIDVAAALALGLVAMFVGAWYARDGKACLADYVREGRWWPPVAPPIHVAVITRSATAVREVRLWE
jgi:hypothetical protein